MPQRSDAFILLYCMEGSAEVSVDLQPYTLTKDNMIFLAPENTLYVTKADHLEVCPLVMSVNYLRQINVELKHIIPLYMTLKHNPVISIDASDRLLFEKYFHLMCSVMQGENTHRGQVVSGIVYSFLFTLHDFACKRKLLKPNSVEADRHTARVFQEFMEHVSRYHHQERSLQFYSDRLHLSPNYLSRLVKRFSGKSAGEWIDLYVVMNAKTRLKYTPDNIQQIAFQLNFPSATFFSKFFKRITGITPTHYRQN